MLNLIPNVKTLNYKEGFLSKKAVCYSDINCDKRVLKVLGKLPFAQDGAKLNIDIIIKGQDREGYELTIDENGIQITADCNAGAFYAIQTLRQIFSHEKIPYLYIKDEPDFKYRGFYHDVTRGKVPTVATLKSLIDQMAYYKLNSLQLYVEHTFEFEEYKDLNEKLGYLSKEEIKELDAYCEENFVEFIPSLSTFGHLYELLIQDKYKHLSVLKGYENPNFWYARMHHHTIDPLIPESFEVIKSLIDQYIPNFKTDYFNICCDETFDLKEYEKKGEDVGKIYIDFVNKIIEYLTEKGKKVMMWGDILLKHPETIDVLPEDVHFLYWEYGPEPHEENIEKFAKAGRKQIVCPGTSSWSRLCEWVQVEEKNISLMAEYGYKHGALGVLNTNWGDWANPCSLELAMYGLVLGAEKAWSVKTQVDDDFYNRVNFVLFQKENGIQLLKELSKIHELVSWNSFGNNYFAYRYGGDIERKECLLESTENIQQKCQDLIKQIKAENWVNEEIYQEMIISAEGICLMAELEAKMSGKECVRLVDTKEWLNKFKNKWLQKNKPSELFRIEEMFTYLAEN